MKTNKPAIWICPDKYRGTLTAMEAATVIAGALGAIANDYDVRIAPMADGGEGTAALLGRLHSATLGRQVATVDPIGNDLRAQWWLNPASAEAFIDSASVIGHDTVDGKLDPWHSSSYGLGVAIRKILDSDPRLTLNVCLGGTVTVDGGAGLLQGLGWRFYGIAGTTIPVPILPGQLDKVYSIVPPSDHEMLSTRIKAISDVKAPLWGLDEISSLTFAPQKGVNEDELSKLRKLLHSWEVASIPLPADSEISGAGGGTGFALQRVVGALASLGAEELIGAYGIFHDMAPGSVVITGEGCLDEQSSAGKVVGTLARRCQSQGITCIVLPGTTKHSQLTTNRSPLTTNVVPCDHFLSDQPLTPEVAKERLRLATIRALETTRLQKNHD